MRKGFTLIEITITIIVLLLLATLGMAGYHQILEKARLKVCEVNQQAIERTAQIADEFEAGILGELPLEELGKAYAQVVSEGGWFTKFSYFLVRLNTPKQAYAAVEDLVDPEKMKKYGLDPQIFICPADKDGPPSYGINRIVGTTDWENIPAETIIVGDCKTAAFDNPNELDPIHFIIPIIKEVGEAQAVIKTGESIVGKPANLTTMADNLATCKANCGNDKHCKKRCSEDIDEQPQPKGGPKGYDHEDDHEGHHGGGHQEEGK